MTAGSKSEFLSHPGHALGPDASVFWSIIADNQAVLRPGMTGAMQPPVLREAGGDGIGIGCTYLITDNGFERFSRVALTELF